MLKAKELARIVKLATARRATLLTRLEKAQLKQDDVACDRIYSAIANENELIHNASHDFEIIEKEAQE